MYRHLCNIQAQEMLNIMYSVCIVFMNKTPVTIRKKKRELLLLSWESQGETLILKVKTDKGVVYFITHVVFHEIFLIG